VTDDPGKRGMLSSAEKARGQREEREEYQQPPVLPAHAIPSAAIDS
jgi:hypothetical protein